jgi:hypothetical protein
MSTAISHPHALRDRARPRRSRLYKQQYRFPTKTQCLLVGLLAMANFVKAALHDFGIAVDKESLSTRISLPVSVTLTPGRWRRNLMSESGSVEEKTPLMWKA